MGRRRGLPAAGVLLLLGAAPAQDFREARARMVELIASYSPEHKVKDPRVLDAMRRVPRHEFVPEDLRAYAYADSPLPIGEGQTISQPFIVAYMTELLALKPADRVLEVGTGSGYHAAVLSLVAREVYTIEILPTLGRRAEETLQRLGHKNVRVRVGDGYRGWPEAAPFDAVIVTCAPEQVPLPLVDQLKTGGRLVIPVGGPIGEDAPGAQELVLVRKTEKGLRQERKMAVRFVPMTGEALK